MSLKLLDDIIFRELAYHLISRENINKISIEESVVLQLAISSDFVNKYKKQILVDLSSHYNASPYSLNESLYLQSSLKIIISSYLSVYFRIFNKNNEEYNNKLPIFFHLCKYAGHYMECHSCGKNLSLYFDFDSMSIKPKLEDSCIFNTISKIHSMELDLSCGQILFANDMRELFGDRDYQDKFENEFVDRENGGRLISVNNTLGRILNTKMWAENGMMYFQTRNTSPGYYFNQEQQYFVFRDAFEEWEEYQDEAPDLDELHIPVDINNEKYLNFISTDLWAVNAMSMDTFRKLCQQNSLNEEEMIEELNIKIHNVKKGIYQCTTYYEEIEDYDMSVYHLIKLKSNTMT